MSSHSSSARRGAWKPMKRLGVPAALLLAVLLALVTTVAATADSGSGSGGSSSTPDFEVRARTDTGYLVRGGLQSCTGNCFGGLVEPKYSSGDFSGNLI